MRRALGTALAFVAAVLSAPAATAAPASGEVVFVSNGPGAADVTLPAKITLDLGYARYQTRGTHLLMTAGPGEIVTAHLVLAPGSDWAFGRNGSLPAGRSTVRMLADGPTTLRVPAKGVRGTKTIRLTRRLNGAVVKTGDATLGVNAARSEIPFSLNGSSIVAHGYASPDAQGAGRHDWLCLGAAGTACVADGDRGSTTVGGPWNESVGVYFGYRHTGPIASKLMFADAGVSGSVTHFVMAYSLR